MSKYEFTEQMGEISGFGGGYEDACRAMLKSGLEYLDENPDCKPEFHGYKNVYGLIMEDNNDAKALSDAVTTGNSDCTGAMHHAVIASILWIREHGWDKYVEEMSKNEGE